MSDLNFRIESSAKAYEILASNLYSDKISAVIRELSCNAADAHIEAGMSTIPFDVDLPTNDKKIKHFRVRDFGTGLRADQIEDVFAVFFSSTKVGSKAYTGAFGLGCKSPFAITDEFFVNSYIDNKKYKYRCHKNNGIPAISFIGDEQSNEKTGLEIIVPINDTNPNEWYSKANKIYEYFKLRPKLNIPLKYFSYSPEYKCGNNWENTNESGVWVIMSNVRYPVDLSKIKDDICNKDFRYKARGIAYHLPPRSISVTPAREDISYTPETLNFLNHFINEVNESIMNNIQNLISKQPSMLKAKLEFVRIYSLNTQEYIFCDKFFLPNRFKWNDKQLSTNNRVDLQIDYDQNVEIGYILRMSKYSANTKNPFFTNVAFANGFEADINRTTILVNDTKASQISIKSWATRKFNQSGKSGMLFMVIGEEYVKILTEYNKLDKSLVKKCSEENIFKLSRSSAQKGIQESKNVKFYICNLDNRKIEKDNSVQDDDLIAELVDENNIVYFIEYGKEYQNVLANHSNVSLGDKDSSNEFMLNDLYGIHSGLTKLSKNFDLPYVLPRTNVLLIRNLKKNKQFMRRYAKVNKIKFVSFLTYFKNSFIKYVENNIKLVETILQKVFLNLITNDYMCSGKFDISLLPKRIDDFSHFLSIFFQNIKTISRYKSESKLLTRICNFIESNNNGKMESYEDDIFSYISETLISSDEIEVEKFMNKYCQSIKEFIEDFNNFCLNNKLIFEPVESKCDKIIEYCITGKIA